jgi:energy-coupling factor transporter ATP-binding protein EcfA2
MIERIVIENFKSLRKVSLKLGHLNLFLGSNASGKSNLFDALRALQGIAGGFTVEEVFNGGAKTRAGGEWPGIRGGLQNARFIPKTRNSPANVESIAFKVHLVREAEPPLDYEFAFGSEGRTTHEMLWENHRKVFSYDGRNAYFHPVSGPLIPCFPGSFLGSELVLAYQAGLAGEQKRIVDSWWQSLIGTQFLSLDPAVLRHYGGPGQVRRMRERGEDFASIVKAVCDDPDSRSAYVSWLRELRPEEVEDADTKLGAQGEPMFRLWEHGHEFLAPVLSEGTLRFAAIAAAFFQPNLPPLLAIEEVDNGIHATRLRLLVELLRSQASRGTTQVIATTHSPIVLGWLTPEEYATTFYCRRDEATGESRICSLAEMPHFKEIIGKHPISDLLADGWMEAAL